MTHDPAPDRPHPQGGRPHGGTPHRNHEHLLEYQDYVLAHRLRQHAGGRNAPRSALLSLREYALKRNERQDLAKGLLERRTDPDARGTRDLRAIDRLTDTLNFGLWHNPNETVEFLRRVIHAGGCPALESDDAFLTELLTAEERAALEPHERDVIPRYYLGLLRASAAYLDPESFTRLRGEIEPLRERMPLFLRNEATPPAGETGETLDLG